MKISDLLLIGGLCLGGYFLYKQMTGGDWDLPNFGGGGAGGDGDGFLGGGDQVPSYAPFPRGGTNTGTAGAPASYEVTNIIPTTTKVQSTGGRTYVFQSAPGSSRAGLITVGTPAQQIQQFNTAPKVVMINGVVKKVM